MTDELPAEWLADPIGQLPTPVPTSSTPVPSEVPMAGSSVQPMPVTPPDPSGQGVPQEWLSAHAPEPAQAGAESALPSAPPERRVNVVKDGQLLNVALSELPMAYADGAHLDRTEIDEDAKTVFLRGQDGRVNAFETSDPELANAFKAGAVLANPDEVKREYGDASSALATFGEQAGMGLTAHVYKPVVRAIFGDDAIAEMEARQQENRIAAISGEVLGTVAGAVALPIGNGIRAAGAARAAAQTGAKHVFTKLAYNAVADGLEQAAYSAVQRTTDRLTGDDERDAESIASLIGSDVASAVGFGAGMRGVGELIGAAGRAIVPKLAGRTVDDVVDGLKGRLAYDAVIGERNLRLRRLAEKKYGQSGVDDLGNYALSRDFVAMGGTTEDAIARMEVARELDAQRIGSLVDELDAKAGVPDGRPIADTLRGELSAMRTDVNADTMSTVDRKLAKVFERLDAAPGSDEAYRSWRDIVQLKRDLGAEINWDRVKQTKADERLADVYHVINDAIASGADAQAIKVGMDQDWSSAWRQANSDFSKTTFLLDGARDAMRQRSNNRMFGLTDVIVGSEVGEAAMEQVIERGSGILSLAGAGAALQGMLAGGLVRAAKNRGPSFMARVMHDFRKAGGSPATVAKRISAASDTFLSSASGAAPRAFVSGMNASEEVDPDRVQSRLDKELSDDNALAIDDAAATVEHVYGPRLGQAFKAQLQRRTDFVRGVVERFPLSNQRNLAKVDRYVKAVDDPLGAVDRIAEAKASDEDYEVLEALHPRMLQDLASRVRTGLMKAARRPQGDAAKRTLRRLGISVPDPSSVRFYQSLTTPVAEKGDRGTSSRPRQADTGFAERAGTGPQWSST